jgi:hypothetical protein
MAMDSILIFLTSLGAAVLANRLARRGPLTRADIAIGVVAGLAGVSLAPLLSVEGAGWSLGLPLLLASCLAIGLESLQDRSVRR